MTTIVTLFPLSFYLRVLNLFFSLISSLITHSVNRTTEFFRDALVITVIKNYFYYRHYMQLLCRVSSCSLLFLDLFCFLVHLILSAISVVTFSLSCRAISTYYRAQKFIKVLPLRKRM